MKPDAIRQAEIKSYYSQELLDGVKPINAETAEFLWNMMTGIGERRMKANARERLISKTSIKTCMNCFHNYGARHNIEFNPKDIVCEYWESDGLTKDDFCSRWKDKESEE